MFLSAVVESDGRVVRLSKLALGGGILGSKSCSPKSFERSSRDSTSYAWRMCSAPSPPAPRGQGATWTWRCCSLPAAGQAVVDRLTEALERASGRTVDLVDLSAAPPLLAHEVVKHGKLIVSRDDTTRVDFVTRAVARYLDTAHLRKVQHHYLRQRVEARGAASR